MVAQYTPFQKVQRKRVMGREPYGAICSLGSKPLIFRICENWENNYLLCMDAFILQNSERNVDQEMLGPKDPVNTWCGYCARGETMFPDRSPVSLMPRWWHSAGLTTSWLWNHHHHLSGVAVSFLAFWAGSGFQAATSSASSPGMGSRMDRMSGPTFIRAKEWSFALVPPHFMRGRPVPAAPRRPGGRKPVERQTKSLPSPPEERKNTVLLLRRALPASSGLSPSLIAL